MGEREAGCACALNDIWFCAAVGKLEWELQVEVPVYQNYPQGLSRGMVMISIKKPRMYRRQAIWVSVRKPSVFGQHYAQRSPRSYFDYTYRESYFSATLFR